MLMPSSPSTVNINETAEMKNESIYITDDAKVNTVQCGSVFVEHTIAVINPA